ncbi:MAG: hypothetical protein QOD07_2726 [Frankiaceae bacterium]|nr:hypothetical protein [Frankiaceae bacterium]
MVSGPDFDRAFPELFATSYRVAFRVLGSASEAEDIAQETLTRAFVRWQRVEDHAGAWVATVAFRLAVDAGRRQNRHPSVELRDASAVTGDWDQRMDLRAALRRLPKRQQQALACRYLAGLPDEETARLLGITVGSVKQHAARGLAALRAVALSTEDNCHA